MTLVERLRAIPVWMVRDMSPGWQEHGTTAYEAAATIERLQGYLRDAVNDLDAVIDSTWIAAARAALKENTDD